MKIYSVGGFVRDSLLSRMGHPVRPGDHDWVVVGETPESMIRRNFLPVGGDFPVFLHPKTHEEFALARTERKTAPGYHGFVFHASPDVTLEEDLRRRDLTINAIAMDASGNLTDPYNGIQDLKAGIIRHVSEAFCEDPVRILRAARFAARFPSFSIAPETLALMRTMVSSGEADALIAERVLAEFVKGLETPVPCRMIEVLEACGFFQRLYPELHLCGALRARLHRASRRGLPMALRLAIFASGVSGKLSASSFLKDLRAPAEAQDFAKILEARGDLLAHVATPEDVSTLFQGCDALRRRTRFETLLDYRELCLLPSERSTTTGETLRRALNAWCSVNAGIIAAAAPSPREIPKLVLAARQKAVEAVWQET